MSVKIAKGGNPYGNVCVMSAEELSDEQVDQLFEEAKNAFLDTCSVVIASNYDINFQTLKVRDDAVVMVSAEGISDDQTVELREHLEKALEPTEFGYLLVTNFPIRTEMFSPIKDPQKAPPLADEDYWVPGSGLKIEYPADWSEESKQNLRDQLDLALNDPDYIITVREPSTFKLTR